MKALQVLFFDLGNTLLYFDGAWPDVFSRANRQLLQTLQDADISLNREHFLKEFRVRLETYYQEREAEFIEHTTAYVLRTLLAEMGHPNVPDQILRPALEAMYAVSQQHWIPEADALPTLQSLKKQNYRLGLISNAADDADVQKLVDKAGIRPFFEVILTSAACGVRKPNPRIFKIAMRNMNAQPEYCAMIGDTLGADILGARNAGLFSIWITRRADTPANRAHADTIRPDTILHSLADIIPFLGTFTPQ